MRNVRRFGFPAARSLHRAALLGITLLTVAAASASCDTAKRIGSKVVAINILLDLGDPLDLAPRHTEAVANFMTISGPIDEPVAEPLSGATATLEIEGVVDPVEMTEETPGVYRVSSATGGTGGSPAFVYTSGADYTIVIDQPTGSHEGVYEMEITAPPRTEVTGLPDTQGGATIPANQALTLQLVGSYDRGIVFVVTSGGDVTYDNRPTDPASAIDFVFGDFDGTIVIPGSAFPNTGTIYGIVVAGLESAPTRDISEDLNILSRFYAGSAKTALVVTDP